MTDNQDAEDAEKKKEFRQRMKYIIIGANVLATLLFIGSECPCDEETPFGDVKVPGIPGVPGLGILSGNDHLSDSIGMDDKSPAVNPWALIGGEGTKSIADEAAAEGDTTRSGALDPSVLGGLDDNELPSGLRGSLGSLGAGGSGNPDEGLDVQDESASSTEDESRSGDLNTLDENGNGEESEGVTTGGASVEKPISDGASVEKPASDGASVDGGISGGASVSKPGEPSSETFSGSGSVQRDHNGENSGSATRGGALDLGDASRGGDLDLGDASRGGDLDLGDASQGDGQDGGDTEPSSFSGGASMDRPPSGETPSGETPAISGGASMERPPRPPSDETPNEVISANSGQAEVDRDHYTSTASLDRPDGEIPGDDHSNNASVDQPLDGENPAEVDRDYSSGATVPNREIPGDDNSNSASVVQTLDGDDPDFFSSATLDRPDRENPDDHSNTAGVDRPDGEIPGDDNSNNASVDQPLDNPDFTSSANLDRPDREIPGDDHSNTASLDRPDGEIPGDDNSNNASVDQPLDGDNPAQVDRDDFASSASLDRPDREIPGDDHSNNDNPADVTRDGEIPNDVADNLSGDLVDRPPGPSDVDNPADLDLPTLDQPSGMASIIVGNNAAPGEVICIPDDEALLAAVDDVLLFPNNSVSEILYGPIEDWCFDCDVTSFDDLFSGDRNSLAKTFNGNITKWDTSGIVSMDGTFRDAHFFNQNLSSWDTSNVWTMTNMFRCASGFNSSLATWDTSTVVDMTGMFYGAKSFNQDLSHFDTSNVWDMWGMFNGAEAFDQDISPWDVSNVYDMGYMFLGAKSFNQDLSVWDVGTVISLDDMFRSAKSFSQDLCTWGRLLRRARIVDGMFEDTSCPNPRMPKAPLGPFCYTC